MAETPPVATPLVPEGADLDRLRESGAACRGCELYRNATRTVFGAGPQSARVMIIGEQPGDVEDRRGVPFVGPAGRILDRALAEVGLDRDRTYVTNVVKHFKFAETGRGRRIHKTPDRSEIAACRPWLLAEYARIRPPALVLLGATAAGALLGPAFRVTRSRGVPLPWPAAAQLPEEYGDAAEGAFVLATVHPSAVLRADDREGAYAGFAADLRVAADRAPDG